MENQYEIVDGKVYGKEEIVLVSLKKRRDEARLKKQHFKAIEDALTAQIQAIKLQTGVDAETVV